MSLFPLVGVAAEQGKQSAKEEAGGILEKGAEWRVCQAGNVLLKLGRKDRVKLLGWINSFKVS